MKPWIVLLCGWLLPAHCHANERAWAALLNDISRLDLPRPELDIAQWWQQQPTTEQLQKHNSQLQVVIRQLHAFEPSDACQSVFTAAMHTALKAQQLRLQLQSTPAHNTTAYQGSIHQLPAGDAWYRYLTLWWLGEEVQPDALYDIGEQAFTQAIAQLRAPRPATDTEPPGTLHSSDDAGIRDAYQLLDQTVARHLAQWFKPIQQVPPVHIARSLQPADFPAPGYYNASNQTMYYHPQKESYGLRQADWLYLHEGVPGHHYQSQVAQSHSRCQLPAMYQGQMAFIEGWAAYVETLGQRLGLYQHPESLRFALKWEALRAMRVMIDVGLHARGWSTAQARAHWQRLFPEGTDVMDREIRRIQRWPMQVNTYVYGKHKIEQLKTQLQLQAEDAAGHRLVHHNLLSISRLPISSLNHYHELFNPQEQP